MKASSSTRSTRTTSTPNYYLSDSSEDNTAQHHSTSSAIPRKRKQSKTAPNPNATGHPKGRGKGRGAVACQTCRLSKVACDLVHPACGACVAKGEGDYCSLGNLLWYDNPEDVPANKLKSHLDRLESMVNKIRVGKLKPGAEMLQSPRPPPRTSSLAFGGGESTTLPLLLVGKLVLPAPSTGQQQQGSTTTTTTMGTLFNGRVPDFESLLSAIPHPPPSSQPPMAHLATPTLLLSSPTPPPTPSSSTTTSTSNTTTSQPSPTPNPLNDLLKILPTRSQSLTCTTSYFSHTDVLHLDSPDSFRAKCDVWWGDGPSTLNALPLSLRGGNNNNNELFLAEYLTITSLGLLTLPDDEGSGLGLPSRDSRSLLARSWLNGALLLLSGSAGCAGSPSGWCSFFASLEGVKCVTRVLVGFWTAWEGGRGWGEARNLVSVVRDAVWELGLVSLCFWLFFFGFSFSLSFLPFISPSLPPFCWALE
ncbi:hypothetical protein T439DRAFT_110150 [Meredithblackwellia eburnea MCA 4105]